MVYTPTLADLPPDDAGGYTPTLADIPPDTLNDKVYASPIAQGIFGAGDALRNTIAGGLDLIPGVHLPMAQTGSGKAYNIGNILGNVAGFIGGGDVLDVARAGAEGLPLVGKIAQGLGGDGLSGVTRRTLGTGLYGAATNPNDFTKGAGEGALFSLGADALPPVASNIGKALGYFQPTKYAQGILDNLGGGQNLEDATKSVIGDIQNAYKTRRDAASDIYNSVRSNIPSNSIYNEINPTNSQYLNLPEKLSDQYTPDIQELHDEFLANPTFDNAHNLQSQIASTIRTYQNGSSANEPATVNAIQALGKSRNALKQDMMGFLNSTAPESANQYVNASNYFLTHVVPYMANPKLFGMATGDITNIKPANLANIFSAPQDDLLKVMADLPQNTVDKILYTKLGQVTPSSSPENLVKAADTLSQQGLGSYVSPDLNNQLLSLDNRIKARNLLESGGGALLGSVIGGSHGVPEALGGFGIGAALGRPTINYIHNKLPLDQIAQAVKNTAKATYPSIRNLALANILNNTNAGGQ